MLSLRSVGTLFLCLFLLLSTGCSSGVAISARGESVVGIGVGSH